MSDTDPTPGTPVTLRDALSWWRGELRGSPPASLRDLVAALGAVQGTPPQTLRDLYQQLSTIEGALDQTLPSIVSRLADLQDRVDNLQSALGAEPYGDLEIASVRGLLWGISRGISQLAGGIAPDILTEDQSSTGSLGIEGKRYALFAPSANLTVDESGRNITAVPSWSGWAAYIQTSAPIAYINGAQDLPSQWIQLVGTGPYNFAVDMQYPIGVSLRPPSGFQLAVQQITQFKVSNPAETFQLNRVVFGSPWDAVIYTSIDGIWRINSPIMLLSPGNIATCVSGQIIPRNQADQDLATLNPGNTYTLPNFRVIFRGTLGSVLRLKNRP